MSRKNCVAYKQTVFIIYIIRILYIYIYTIYIYIYIYTIYNTNICIEKYTKLLERRGKFFFIIFLHNKIEIYIHMYI